PGRHNHPPLPALVRPVPRARASSEVWEGAATLELFGADHEEIDALAPIRIGRGYRFSFGYTVDDLETVRDLRG
ncbi:MAG: acetoacetate decarboxylase family protein, partial [Gaiella sp.]